MIWASQPPKRRVSWDGRCSTLVSVVQELDPDDGTIKVERSIEEGRQVVEGKLPAVVTVSKDIAEPRYPSFMGIRKAARADIPVWTLADLEVDVLPRCALARSCKSAGTRDHQ